MKIKHFIFIVPALTSLILTAQNQPFMQQLHYDIEVELNDSDNTLDGNIRILYKNNSEDSLEFIYFHLWPNAFKDNSTAWAKQSLFLRNRDFFFSDISLRAYIDSLDFKVNKIKSQFIYDSVNIDIGKLILPEKLLPSQSVEIETRFFVKLPKVWSRLGYQDDNYFITHWYPKPAVYNQDGWHPMPYLSMGEFYQEFASWQVKITLPVKYIVAANGNLVSREELHRLEDYAMACNKGEQSDAFTYKDSTALKTLIFEADRMIDFAWFASKDFIVKSENLFLPETQKYVKCWMFYRPENKHVWEDAMTYVKNSLSLFSEIIGEYPYPYCIIVEDSHRGGGMEYPGIVTVLSDNKNNLERIIAHEIAHIWFYGVLANNERIHPWIDEGFASYYELRYKEKYMQDFHPAEDYLLNGLFANTLLKLSPDYIRELTWLILKRENLSQAPGLASNDFSPVNYFVMLYNKTALALKSLEKFIGRELFDEMIRAFYLEYSFKHINPEDINSFFSEYTQKDLTWFFHDMIYSDKKPDYKIVKQKNDSIYVKNKGDVESPVFLNIGDSLIISEGFKDLKSFPNQENKPVIIDPYFYGIDFNRRNNYYFPTLKERLRRHKFRFAHIVDRPDKIETAWLIFPGFNLYDGFMPGLIVYNSVIPKKAFEYQIAPMFGVKSQNISGFFRVSAFIHPNVGKVRELEIYSSGQKYSAKYDSQDFFTKLEQGLNIKFKTSFTQYHNSEFFFRNIFATDYIFNEMRSYQQAGYYFNNYRVINPFSAGLNIERSYGYLKSWLELNYQITYNQKGKALDLRLFTGAFLYNSDEYYGNYNFRLSGNLGTQDYLYDHIFPGRFEDIRTDAGNIFAHQFIKNQGGFAIYSPYGQTNKWIGAINMTTCLPVPLLRAYMNLGIVADNDDYFKPGDSFYELGLELRLPGGFSSVFFPIVLSKQIKDASDNIYTENYLQKIRFTLYLEKINPVKHRDKFYLLY